MAKNLRFIQCGDLHLGSPFHNLAAIDDRWQRIINSRNLRTLHRVLVDTSTDGIEMREVSPMTGFLTEDERLGVLAGIQR